MNYNSRGDNNNSVLTKNAIFFRSKHRRRKFENNVEIFVNRSNERQISQTNGRRVGKRFVTFTYRVIFLGNINAERLQTIDETQHDGRWT